MKVVKIAALMVLGLALAAQADVLTLQNGLGGYTGCDDTWLGYNNGYFSYGVAWKTGIAWYDDMRAFAGLGNAYYKSLVRFNAIPLSPGTTVTSAKLYLHKNYGQSAYTYANVTAYKVLHTWVEGQGGTGHTDQNWTTDSLSGANANYWNAATQLGKGTKTAGYTYVYQNNVPAGITIHHAQHGSGYEATMFAEESSIAAVNGNDNSWYHDTTNNILYFRDGHAGVFDSTGMSYYTSDDRWGATAGTGAGDIDLGSAVTGDWPDGTASGSGYVDITAFVQEWVESPSANHGVLLTAGSGEIGWRMSEWGTQAQRPYLEIEFEAGAGVIPEPAGLGLVGMALLSLRRRRRMKAVQIVAVVGLALGLVGAAHADEITLQDGLGGYTGVKDTRFADDTYTNWGGDDCVTHGINIQYGIRTYQDLSDSRFKGLVGFDLSGLPAIASLTSAKLEMYKYGGGGGWTTGVLKAWRVLKEWDEGTAPNQPSSADYTWIRDGDPNWQVVDGACGKYGRAIHVAAKTVAECPHPAGYTNAREVFIGAGLDFAEAHYATHWHAPWTAKSSIAEVDAATKSYFYDSATGMLYFRTDGYEMGVGYYLNSDSKWDGIRSTGNGDIDKSVVKTGVMLGGVTGAGWCSVDITDYVQYWLDHPAENFGVHLGSSGDCHWRSSEYDAGGATPYEYGPKLIMEFEPAAGPIPEPAGLGLIGMALLALRRRKTRSSTLLRRPAMKAKALLMVLTGGLLVALTGTASAVPWELPDDTVLAVDFGPTEPPTDTTEAGWVSFQCGADNTWLPGPYQHTYGTYTVTVSATSTPSSGLELRARRGTSPADAGDFTWGDVYNDHVFTYNTMMIKIQGLEADHTYEKLYLLNIGGGGAGGRVSKMWLSVGSPSTPVLHTVGAAEPVTNDDPGSIMELADPTADAFGELEISFTTNSGSSVSSWTNGFILVDYPGAPPIPEPAGLGLMSLAVLALRRRRS